jgi:hypothetical protein
MEIRSLIFRYYQWLDAKEVAECLFPWLTEPAKAEVAHFFCEPNAEPKNFVSGYIPHVLKCDEGQFADQFDNITSVTPDEVELANRRFWRTYHMAQMNAITLRVEVIADPTWNQRPSRFSINE